MTQYEWALTEKFDPKSPEHQKIKKQILVGDGLPDLLTTAEIDKCMKDAGFEIVSTKDVASDPDTLRRFPVPWYYPFTTILSAKGLGTSFLGIYLIYSLLYIFESIGLVAKGSTLTHGMLIEAYKGLYEGGRSKIFTPSYLVIGRRPLDS